MNTPRFRNGVSMNQLRFSLVTCLAGALVSAPAARAQTEIDQTRPAAADVRLSVDLINGKVLITGWDKKEVHVGGTLGEDVEELFVEGREERIHIEVDVPDRWHGHTRGTELDIHAPKGARVHVDGVNVAIEVSNIEGRLILGTVNGAVTVAGNPETLAMETVNGPLRFTGSCNEVVAEAVSGGIELEGVTGRVSAQTVSGGIQVTGGAFTGASFSTVSGQIDFRGSLHGTGIFDFESHSGTVTLLLDDEPSAEFDIETFSGSIDSDFGPEPSPKRRWGPGKEMSFTVGKGAAQVTITSFSGVVRIRKR